MTQSYKSLYFRDRPQASSGRLSSLTLAFGKNDRKVYEAVRYLSSDALRRALGYHSFAALREAARKREQSINAFCMSILRCRIDDDGYANTTFLPRLEPGNPVLIDPIQATFNGGRHKPLHDWYPYLEGYSPAFVESVIGSYCPAADNVFDPFAGIGTTPLTALSLGRQAFFSEINPVLQFLTAAKATALQLQDRERATLAADLLVLADGLGERLDKTCQDERLRHAYRTVFGESAFFDDDTFEEVLRCRTLIDDMGCAHPMVARFMTVSVLRSLIPSSLLIRRGDLRFRTEKELADKRPGLRQAVRDSIKRIAEDIESLCPIDHSPVLILENARNLDRLPTLSIDATITSPPYLNGTNYFRNTKVELWFLRCLRDRRDLARFRFGSLTVGINDVTIGKPIGDMPSAASSILGTLEDKAYDSRIPRMIACFASEMHAILRALSDHMREDGTVVIDIGDSAYAGVHVPTDRFITESLASVGFGLHDQIVLRQRYSRGGMKLTQKLLVFQNRSGRHPKTQRSAKRTGVWQDAWTTFKSTLPHQQGEYRKRNWGHPLHSLCSYQGKMKPSLAAHLIKTFSKPGDRILDPFSGVGTIPFEAALHGIECWGFDISPPAVHITAGKIGNRNTLECRQMVDDMDKYIGSGQATKNEMESAASIRFNGLLTSYFHADTLNEILLARRYFLENPPANPSQSLVFSCLLHILHGNRPYALSRRSHPITPFAPTGDTEYRTLIPRLRNKVERSIDAPLPKTFVYGHSVFQDATSWWPAQIRELDVVITSPPFFDSTRFHVGNWMRLWFSVWEVRDFRDRPTTFIDERQKLGFDVYRPVLRQCRERLKKNRVAVFHLGSSRKCDMADELARIAKTWFRVSDVYRENVSHCESHGIRDKGTVITHQYLVLQ